jgi:DNA-binding CsgD family transcriptional regulator
LGDERSVAVIINNLGVQAYQNGDYDQAAAYLQEALATFEALNDTDEAGRAIFHLGEVARAIGDLPLAAERYRQDIAISRKLGNLGAVAGTLLELVVVAAANGQYDLAARCLGASEAIRPWRDQALRPEEIAEYEAAIAAIKRALGERAFAAARASGSVLGIDAAITEAARVASPIVATGLSVGSAAEADVPTPTAHFGLSPREREVLALLAKRLTDREIAEVLFLSPHTVHRHATNIFAKLGAANRREAAALAVRLGLA